jgi:hypothetical protein
MAEVKSRSRKVARKTVGRSKFAKISLIEGITMKTSSHSMFGEFDAMGLSADERRKRITAKYKQKKA